MSSVSFIGIGGMGGATAARAVAGGNAVELIGRDAAKADGLAGQVLAQGRSLYVFFAGDDARAKASVSTFIKSLALRPLDVGGSRWPAGWKVSGRC